MVIKLNGGSTDLHMVSLVDMQKLSDSIQKISYIAYCQSLSHPTLLNEIQGSGDSNS